MQEVFNASINPGTTQYKKASVHLFTYGVALLLYCTRKG